MYHVMAVEGLCTLFDTPSGVLRSMGYAISPSVITILGTVVFRIIWLLTAFRVVPTYEVLMSVYPVSWVLTGGTLIAMYYWALRKQRRLA